MALTIAQQLRQTTQILFLLGEVCRNARQTWGSVHLQAASPDFPASCSKPAGHSSPPFPSLPRWASCLLWLHELHTIPRKQKQFENIKDSSAQPPVTCNANYTCDSYYKDQKSGKLRPISWFCSICLCELRQVIFSLLPWLPMCKMKTLEEMISKVPFSCNISDKAQWKRKLRVIFESVT